MTQQSEANVQVLGIFRFCLAISLMLFLMWGVTSQYQEQRRQAQIAVMSALASRFAEQVAQLHGLWLSQNRPAQLHAVTSAAAMDERGQLQMQATPGVTYAMSSGGWPLGVVSDTAESSDCEQLWRALLAMAPDVDGTPVVIAPLTSEPGCDFRLESGGFSYRFNDGFVTVADGK